LDQLGIQQTHLKRDEYYLAALEPKQPEELQYCSYSYQKSAVV
jgi:hypothetical protein